VAACGFGEVYLDVNAISPTTAAAIAAVMAPAGASFVDGGIIGAPPSVAGTTRLYLAGQHAGEVAALFERSLFGSLVLGDEIGQASALKACYAGWTKTTNALVLAVRAAARGYGVEEALLSEWRLSQPDLEARSEWAASFTAPRAWRYAGEMDEHARSFADVGVPGTFHTAASEVFAKLASFKDAEEVSVDDALGAIGGEKNRSRKA
jgi:hypothetical protein